MPSIWQSVLHPAGPHAGAIHGLWSVMLWTCVGVFVAVLSVLLLAIRRGRHHDRPPTVPVRLLRSVEFATLATVVILIALLWTSVKTGRAMQTIDAGATRRVIVAGYQWWWAIDYDDSMPARRVRVANELHVPVGETVALELASADVIHSFWAPNLNGKIDLVPGRINRMTIRADRPGVYRAQCAEFCGVQHAHMSLLVVAEPPADFDAWLDAQRRTATAATPDVARGLAIVERGACAMCHTVRGTRAGARTAPDLTHVGSRRTLAAGTLPNTPEDLRRWLTDPQAIKPGTKMPRVPMSDDDLSALVAYLERLK
jgi:cytochrome c oxidase subunit 2